MGRSGNSPLPPSSSLYSCINPAVECSQTRFHSRKHESASSQRSSTPIPHETGQEKNPGMGGGFSLGSRWTKAGCLSWCLEEGWIGLEVGGFSLTDIQYTQLMPLTGNSNIIICAGRSHLLSNMSNGRRRRREISTQAPTWLGSRVSEQIYWWDSREPSETNAQNGSDH